MNPFPPLRSFQRYKLKIHTSPIQKISRTFVTSKVKIPVLATARRDEGKFPPYSKSLQQFSSPLLLLISIWQRSINLKRHSVFRLPSSFIKRVSEQSIPRSSHRCMVPNFVLYVPGQTLQSLVYDRPHTDRPESRPS